MGMEGLYDMRRPICLIGLAFVLFILLYQSIHPLAVPDLEEFDKSAVILQGQVEKKEKRISNGQEVLVLYLGNVQVLNPQTIEIKKENKIEGVIAYMEAGQEAETGSYVRIRGRLRTFAKATNPGEFDARGYYQILNMQARIQNAAVLSKTESYSRFREGLYRIRSCLAGLIDGCYGEKDASIMKAMLLGEKSGLDEEIRQLYQVNGIIHILSISGLHISVIGMGLHKILHRLRCPKLPNVIVSILFMYCYGVMTGMSVSALRAVMMFAFHTAAAIFGRTYDMLTAMAVAALTILLQQPLYLYHSGFLFSFGAIAAIGLFLPVLKENLFGETKLEMMMSTSFAVSLTTLPVFLCFYYEYPLYSLFLNLLIIPGAGLIVSGGMASLAAASIYLPLAKCISFPLHMLFNFYEACCTFVLRLPGSRSILGKPETIQTALFCLILACVVCFSAKWSKLQFWQWILAALLCLTVRVQDGLQITVVDVGQGDGIYIADERGRHYLIDGGSSSKSDVGTYQILPFLKEEGADHLDAVFLTHMDADHYNGVETLMEQADTSGITIKNLILPDLDRSGRNGKFEEFEALARRQKIPVWYIHRGDTLQYGDLRFTCLHPEKASRQETNEASVVLYLEYKSFSALFTGDLEGSGEEAVRMLLASILSSGKRVSLLKVAHHGSGSSTGQPFLETASPRIALISAGKNNRYGHPHRELLDRLEQAGCHIYQTAESGAVTVRVRQDGRQVGVEEYLR